MSLLEVRPLHCRIAHLRSLSDSGYLTGEAVLTTKWSNNVIIEQPEAV